jgi:hypothetical protein
MKIDLITVIWISTGAKQALQSTYTIINFRIHMHVLYLTMCYKLIIKVPVYMAQDVMIVKWATSITKATGRVRPFRLFWALKWQQAKRVSFGPS